ncbi:hypothetical protein A9Z06_03195 [Rhizobium sp. YK2]|nr:hypothetical protein A9Z06_03195 [Rhizobium sp. YK2]
MCSPLKFDGLDVPSPVPASRKQSLVRLPANRHFAKQHADVVSWIDGVPLGQSGVPLSHSAEMQADTFFRIGQSTATGSRDVRKFRAVSSVCRVTSMKA